MDKDSPKDLLRGIETTKQTYVRIETALLRAALCEHSIQLLLRVAEQMHDTGDRLIVQASIDILREREGS